jgi:hypothetical protein
MATKSQQYRAEQERARQQHPTATPHHHDPRLTHNDAHRVDAKATYAIEEHRGPASRKSTRGSSNHAKSDSALRITARVRNASPEARASRKSGNPM